MLQLKKLTEKWQKESINSFSPANLTSIQAFQSKNNVVLPNDLIEYFSILNGTGNEYTDDLYEFYPIERIKTVSNEFRDWNGIPNYQPLVNLVNTQRLFVFANFSFNLFVYAIKLNKETAENNEVYVLCGEEYKKIANNFTGFLELYLNDSIELQFNTVLD